MSPEQTLGRADYTPACDIWALGVILYELLGGAAAVRSTTTPVELYRQIREPTPPPPIGRPPRRTQTSWTVPGEVAGRPLPDRRGRGRRPGALARGRPKTMPRRRPSRRRSGGGCWSRRRGGARRSAGSWRFSPSVGSGTTEAGHPPRRPRDPRREADRPARRSRTSASEGAAGESVEFPGTLPSGLVKATEQRILCSATAPQARSNCERGLPAAGALEAEVAVVRRRPHSRGRRCTPPEWAEAAGTVRSPVSSSPRRGRLGARGCGRLVRVEAELVVLDARPDAETASSATGSLAKPAVPPLEGRATSRRRGVTLAVALDRADFQSHVGRGRVPKSIRNGRARARERADERPTRMGPPARRPSTDGRVRAVRPRRR